MVRTGGLEVAEAGGRPVGQRRVADVRRAAPDPAEPVDPGRSPEDGQEIDRGGGRALGQRLGRPAGLPPATGQEQRVDAQGPARCLLLGRPRVEPGHRALGEPLRGLPVAVRPQLGRAQHVDHAEAADARGCHRRLFHDALRLVQAAERDEGGHLTRAQLEDVREAPPALSHGRQLLVVVGEPVACLGEEVGGPPACARRGAQPGRRGFLQQRDRLARPASEELVDADLELQEHVARRLCRPLALEAQGLLVVAPQLRLRLAVQEALVGGEPPLPLLEALQQPGVLLAPVEVEVLLAQHRGGGEEIRIEIEGSLEVARRRLMVDVPGISSSPELQVRVHQRPAGLAVAKLGVEVRGHGAEDALPQPLHDLGLGRAGSRHRLGRVDQLPARGVEELGLNAQVLGQQVVRPGDDDSGRRPPRELSQVPSSRRRLPSAGAATRGSPARHHREVADSRGALGQRLRDQPSQCVEGGVGGGVHEGRDDDAPGIERGCG